MPAAHQAVEIGRDANEEPLLDDEHQHYSKRAPWLRAFILGANDGLVSVASLILGVGGGTNNLKYMRLAGLAGLVGGALSMACGEYISVASQKDSEEADILKEIQEQQKGPQARRHELEELVNIYINRGLSESLAREVAEELTAKDVIRAHARDELGIDLDELANPLQACLTSAVAFSIGAGIPLLAGAFIVDYNRRIVAVSVASAVALVAFGATGAFLGGVEGWRFTRAAARVLVGGVSAMGITYGVGLAFGGVGAA